jgi:hypothetical protein
MLSEIGRGLDQAGVRLADLRLPLWRIHLQVCPFVEGSKIGTFYCVGDHHEVIAGNVSTSRCLNGYFETRLDDRRVYRARQIQAFPHCPGGREQFVNRGEVHRGVALKTTTESFKLGNDIGVGVTGKLVGSPSYLVKAWLMALGWW